ncbi:MAG: hypothetical protein ACK4XY_06010 [Chloroherpetonaceae bacterium]
MMKYFLVCAFLLFCAACGTASVKSINLSCKKEPRTFTREASEILIKNEYKILEADEMTGAIKAFRKESEMLMGDKPIVVSSKILETSLTGDSIKVVIYSVGRDNKTPIRYWNERSTDEFEKTSYMPVLNALKDLCK